MPNPAAWETWVDGVEYQRVVVQLWLRTEGELEALLTLRKDWKWCMVNSDLNAGPKPFRTFPSTGTQSIMVSILHDGHDDGDGEKPLAIRRTFEWRLGDTIHTWLATSDHPIPMSIPPATYDPSWTPGPGWIEIPPSTEGQDPFAEPVFEPFLPGFSPNYSDTRDQHDINPWPFPQSSTGQLVEWRAVPEDNDVHPDPAVADMVLAVAPAQLEHPQLQPPGPFAGSAIPAPVHALPVAAAPAVAPAPFPAPVSSSALASAPTPVPAPVSKPATQDTDKCKNTLMRPLPCVW
ncbi:hypothetical protein C8Q78DRAFT_991651 [Trametes maxima]|nr:hypothetical protein C8Q78DRAFT_991651 [Trametes maxima]